MDQGKGTFLHHGVSDSRRRVVGRKHGPRTSLEETVAGMALGAAGFGIGTTCFVVVPSSVTALMTATAVPIAFSLIFFRARS